MRWETTKLFFSSHKETYGKKFILIMVVIAGKRLSRMYLKITELLERNSMSGNTNPPNMSNNVKVLLALLYLEKLY